MNHKLKIKTAFFEAVKDGRKNFEIRYNDDRGFNAGDTVTLLEVEDGSFRRATGRTHECEITYVTAFEQKPGWVVFGHKPVHESELEIGDYQLPI